MTIINWKKIKQIEDGCGGVIYKVVDVDNSELKNVELAMCIFNPNEVANLHYHEHMEEIYFILDGAGEIEINGTWHSVKIDDAIAIPRKARHRIRNSSDSRELKFLSINSPEWRMDDMIIVKET